MTRDYNDQDAADLAALLSVDPTTAPLAEGQERLWF